MSRTGQPCVRLCSDAKSVGVWLRGAGAGVAVRAVRDSVPPPHAAAPPSGPSPPSCPRPRAKNVSGSNVYLCGVILGHVGNALFNYVSIVGIARANNMTLYIRDQSVLPDVIQNPPGRATSAREYDEKCSSAVTLTQPKCCAFYPHFMHLPKDDHYQLISCLITWKYFYHIPPREVKALLRFRDDVLTQAQGIVGRVRAGSGNATMVGIHIRRGDQTDWMAYLHGHVGVTPEYVHRAMTYFLQRFAHVHFLVASEDTAWCTRYVGQGRSDVTIMTGNSAALDIASLTLTDHMIISTGTYGWWAGYLNPGIKTYMKGFVAPNSHFAKSFNDINGTEYFYPGWIPL